MSLCEFRNRVSLIASFAAKVNKEDIPFEMKRTLIKIYAYTLQINLSERMAENLIL